MGHTIVIETYLKGKILEMLLQSFYLVKKLDIEKSTSNENMENICRLEMECQDQYIVYDVSIISGCQNELTCLKS